MNYLLLIDMIFAGIERISKLQQLYTKSRSEGRDVTDEELDSLRTEDDQARTDLEELIAKKRAGG